MKDLSEQASRFLDFRVFSNPRSENSRAGRFGVERVGWWGGPRSRRRKSNIPPVNPLNLSRCLNEEGPVGEDVQLTEKGTKKKRKEEKKKQNCARCHLMAILEFLSLSFSFLFFPSTSQRQILAEHCSSSCVRVLPDLTEPSRALPASLHQLCFLEGFRIFELTQLGARAFRCRGSFSFLAGPSSRFSAPYQSQQWLLIGFDARSWYCLRAEMPDPAAEYPGARGVGFVRGDRVPTERKIEPGSINLSSPNSSSFFFSSPLAFRCFHSSRLFPKELSVERSDGLMDYVSRFWFNSSPSKN